ncbi:hypothetical protein XA68_12082 [Ophiocordyceps unilateralis]|uniref:Uncharacterized protein n=1 Tax=Ophiocordyceps unilateralis TaxID=268505 RepID=A0A2A9PFG2_OPHUN|nr:hypothetical protein XA68_12082 [Ophiocordyceps unilateralis]
MYRASISTRRSSTLSTVIRWQCRQPFVTTATLLSGHNKWSKTKHIKAATDKKKVANRGTFAKLIATLSRINGDDLTCNPELVRAISAATKAQVPKSVVDAAIARGQGKSPTGQQLITLTYEFLVPPNITMIAEIETDNKARALQDLNQVVKKNGARVSSTAHNFKRLGRIILEAKDEELSLATVMGEALSYDVTIDATEVGDGRFEILLDPMGISEVTRDITRVLEVNVVESDLVYIPNRETVTTVNSGETAKSLALFLSSLRECPDVKAVYANVGRGDIGYDEWSMLTEHLDTYHINR